MKLILTFPVLVFLVICARAWWLVAALGICMGLLYKSPEMLGLSAVNLAVGLSVEDSRN